MSALGRRHAISHVQRWVQVGGLRFLGGALQLKGADSLDYKCQSLAVLEIEVMTVRESRARDRLFRNLMLLCQTLGGSVQPLMTQLTGAWNGRAREKYLVDSFP